MVTLMSDSATWAQEDIATLLLQAAKDGTWSWRPALWWHYMLTPSFFTTFLGRRIDSRFSLAGKAFCATSKVMLSALFFFCYNSAILIKITIFS